jgi:DNA-binding CsgD family transcriptional regulator
VSSPEDFARPGTPVTAAERQALDAMLRHGTVKEAAAALGKSPNTVSQQLATVRVRLGVTTTIEAVRVVYLEQD